MKCITCEEIAHNEFLLNEKQFPICENCANRIVVQQLKYLVGDEEIIKEFDKPKKSRKVSIQQRAINFKKECSNGVSKYGVEMVKEFYNYWSEPNTMNTRMRFEMQKTWEINRRLATWSKNSNKTGLGGSLFNKEPPKYEELN